MLSMLRQGSYRKILPLGRNMPHRELRQETLYAHTWTEMGGQQMEERMTRDWNKFETVTTDN